MTISRGLAAFLLTIASVPVVRGAAEPPLAQWRFDTGDSVAGAFKMVEGVSGLALRLDGYTTRIIQKAAEGPRISSTFSVDAWIALGAYPWNWCPILAQEKDGEAGYFFGIGPRGELGLRLAAGGRWITVESARPLPLRRFTHVAAVFRENDGVRLYVDGVEAGRLVTAGSLKAAPEQDIVLGANREKVMPSYPVPPAEGTRPSWFSLDGILDEVRLFNRALAPEEIASEARRPQASMKPDLPPRVLPSGPPGPGRFGAYYTNLRYYEDWDALWPVSDHPDIVVQFDGSPVRVVFWRGLRYSPAWVTENGLWLADQGMESGNPEGCVEHMQDIHTKYSSVRIIESTPARVVVHWRYAPVSGHDNNWIANERSGFEWWVDEYYTFMPDGTGVRKVRWRRPEASLAFPWLEIQETSVLAHPGQNAKDVLSNDALTYLDLDGNSATYSWPDDKSVNTRERRNMAVDPSIVKDLKPETPVIQVVKMRSQAKPFVIYEPGTRPHVYVGRVRDEVVNFPAYNHWPESLVRSDGRFVQAADRTTSWSISQNYPPEHDEGNGYSWVALLYGATFGEPQSLVPLARSWNRAPELRVLAGTAESRGFDIGQRGYTLNCAAGKGCGALRFEFAATAEQPLVNALVVIEGFGDGAANVSVNGQRLEESAGLRLGRRRTIQGTDLIVWLERAATGKVEVRITGAPPPR
ncbi:MAG: LamG domain-containing protein [Alphaproteobacteria bacterium]|nr:LamG domain-containing protein [Alphaproteobacteria bacterium]